MSALLSIRQAAERLGVSMDTLRQWEHDGRVTAERTAGGHRRFRVEDVERLLAGRPKGVRTAPAAPGAPADPIRPVAMAKGARFPASTHLDPFWEGQLKDARARVEVKRLRREAMEHQAQIDRRRALAQQEEEERGRRERHRGQLQELKAFGRALVPAAIGTDGRAEITRDLEDYVTAERFPLELPPADSQVVVQARVSGAIARLEQQRAEGVARAERERRRASDQLQLEWLISSGVNVARRETGSWETVDQLRALRDVEEQLGEEVRADWSHSQVQALVTEILSEFEEYDEDDDRTDPEDDDEDANAD